METESEVTIESVDFGGSNVTKPATATITLVETPAAGGQMRFSLEGLPTRREVQLQGVAYAGNLIDSGNDRTIAVAAVLAFHYSGATPEAEGVDTELREFLYGSDEPGETSKILDRVIPDGITRDTELSAAVATQSTRRWKRN